MMKDYKKIFLALHILTVAGLGYLLYSQKKSNRIAYVRCNDLVYGYWGMQEAEKAFEEKQKGWKANMDSLQMSYQQDVMNYKQEEERLNEKELHSKQQYLMQEKQNLLQYSQAMDKKAKEEDEKLTAGALNQINSFVAGYGKENGYKIILGTTQTGNLLYGEESIDLTDELLEALNRSYQEGKIK